MKEYVEPPKPIDETGKRYGALLVVERVQPEKWKKRARKGTSWLCLCACGTKVEVPGTLLRRGFVKSCEQCAKGVKWWEKEYD